jgi:hypothetical protein
VVRDLGAECQLGTGPVRKCRVDLWLALRDTHTRALCEFHNEVVEFVLAVADVRDDLFVVTVVDEHPGVVPVTRDVLDVDVVLYRVDTAVTDKIPLEHVQHLLDLVLRELPRVLRQYHRLRSGREPREVLAYRVAGRPVVRPAE